MKGNGRKNGRSVRPGNGEIQKSFHWNWFAREPFEILCDLDSKRALFRAFQVLRRVMTRKLLSVEECWLFPSEAENHYHLIVRLIDGIMGQEAALWALWMGSDRLRGIYILERIRRGVLNADVISTHWDWSDYRIADSECWCKDKHKRKAVTDHCPAMTQLMLDARSTDYFPRNFDLKEREPFDVPIGRVPKGVILGRI